MSIEEYFDDWMPCIDKELLQKTIRKVKEHKYLPKADKWFSAFRMCHRRTLNTVFLLQDPYPQEGVATGIALANSKETFNLSPSLKVVKERLTYFDYPKYLCTFDQTLESWCKQGVLMLNTALTVEPGKPASHQLIWRPFIEFFLKKLCAINPGIVYVLMGGYAETFKNIVERNNHVILCKHPAYYARTNQVMPDVFTQVNKILYKLNKIQIKWVNFL